MDNAGIRLTLSLSPPGQSSPPRQQNFQAAERVHPYPGGFGLPLSSPRQHRLDGERSFPSPPPHPQQHSQEAGAPLLGLYLSPSPPRSEQAASASAAVELLPPPRAYSEQEGSLYEFRPPPRAYSQEGAEFRQSPPPAFVRQASLSPLELIPSPPARLTQESEPERSRPRRGQSSADRSVPKVKEEVIEPPFPWATNRRAMVHPLDWILRSGISSITGEVVCKRCDGIRIMDIDLQMYFLQLDNYFMSNKNTMHDRAPKEWMNPRLFKCELCFQNDCVRPVIPKRKRDINWLFMMLTKTLGVCTLDHLKYFCKHTHNHRTGAKDRVLYLTYVGLLDQLNPGKYVDVNGKVL